jgi:hypothetical protein
MVVVLAFGGSLILGVSLMIYHLPILIRDSSSIWLGVTKDAVNGMKMVNVLFGRTEVKLALNIEIG